VISKKQYLEAKKIVDAYKLQQKQINATKKSKKESKKSDNFFSSWDNTIKNIKM
jgi:hypothetical protein